MAELSAGISWVKRMLWRTARRRDLRRDAPRVLCIVSGLSVLWLVYSLAWPVRLPQPDAREATVEHAPVTVHRDVKAFAESEQVIRSKVLFAPPVPIVSQAAGAVVVEELLKKIQLAGITNLNGAPAAIIRVNGKGALYKVGDKVGSFVLHEVFMDKVVLMIDGQTVELAR